MAVDESLKAQLEDAEPEKKKRQRKKVTPSPEKQDIGKDAEPLAEIINDTVTEIINETEVINKVEVEKIAEDVKENTPKKQKKAKKKDNVKKKESSKKVEPVKETPLDETSFLNKLIKKKKVSNKESFSVTLWEDLDNIIQQVQDITDEKQNSIINHILSEVYDTETKTFKLDIPAEVKQNDKATSYLIEEKHLKAIKKTANKLNMSAAAYFNKLILKYAQEYILPDIEKKNAEKKIVLQQDSE